MFGSVISVVGMIQSTASVVTLVFVLVAMMRPDSLTREESERAEMRSLSWPAVS